MTDILLPPPLTESQVKALACAFIRGEAYIPTGFDDPRFTPLLRVVIHQRRDRGFESRLPLQSVRWRSQDSKASACKADHRECNSPRHLQSVSLV